MYGVFVYWMMLEFHFNFLIYSFNNYIVIMSAAGAGVVAGVVAGVAAGIDIQGTACKELFVTTFPGTVFLDPHEICSYFKINAVWPLSEEASHHDVQTVVASLQFHSMLLLSPTPGPDPTRPDVYHANLEYELVDNVTRITGADLVPQHAYYYLVMKIYELFLHPAASESMFHPDMEYIAKFITEQLNSGLADGRAFFEDKVRRFLHEHPDFLQTTDAQELQNNINAIWDLLRSDEYKNAGKTVQKGIVSTISRLDVDEYSLKGQGTVSVEGTAAFKKTVYGFHVLVYIGGHVISMSLSREDLFHDRNENVFSFFNSDMIKYMASTGFAKQVDSIIEKYNFYKRGGGPVPLLRLGELHHLTFVECGCKSPGLLHYDSTGKLTLTTDTKLPGRREPIVGNSGDGRRYILVDNFPLPGSMNTILYVVTYPEGFTGLPNFCEYGNTDAVNRVLGIEYGDNGVDSMGGVNGDSPLRIPGSQEQEEHSRIVQAALVHASNGAPNVVVSEKAEDVASSKEEMYERGEGAAAAPAGPPSNPGMSSGRFFGTVMSGLGTACNFIRSIFFPHTPTCSAEDDARNYANIGFRQHVVFCAPTKEEDIAIKGLPESAQEGVVIVAASLRRKKGAMTQLPWSEAREFFFGNDDSSQGGRRHVSRKYRNNKKNISRKKGKKRMSLRHRRSRRRLRRRSHSLCLKKLK